MRAWKNEHQKYDVDDVGIKQSLHEAWRTIWNSVGACQQLHSNLRAKKIVLEILHKKRGNLSWTFPGRYHSNCSTIRWTNLHTSKSRAWTNFLLFSLPILVLSCFWFVPFVLSSAICRYGFFLFLSLVSRCMLVICSAGMHNLDLPNSLVDSISYHWEFWFKKKRKEYCIKPEVLNIQGN